jgi:hypothetical protein
MSSNNNNETANREQSNDNSSIKVNDTQTMNQASNIFNFMKILVMITLFILIIFVLGSIIVFSGKVTQSNVLPTDINCFPYTTAIPIIQQISININDHNIDGQNLSQKIKFPYNINSSNFILDFLRKTRLNPNASGIVNYFIAILESFFSFNYSAYNFLFESLNYLPEIVVLLFGPFITIIFSSILSLVDSVYLAYLWFSNFNWFFQENENKSGTGSPIWKSISIFEPLNYGLSLFLSLLFFILFFIAFFSFFPLLSFITIILCFITIVSCTAMDSNNNKYNTFNCIKDSLKYNKKGIMLILSLCIILLSFNYFGPILACICGFVILLLYFNIIPLSIFNSTIPTNLSPLVNDKQASKKCNFEKQTSGANSNMNNRQNTSTSNKNMNKGNTSTSNKENLFQKIGNFLPKFPEIFPTFNVVESYNTPLPSIPYPKVEIGKLQLPDLKLPEEVEIKFPDVKLPELPKIKLPEEINNAVIGLQDKTLKGLHSIDKALKIK